MEVMTEEKKFGIAKPDLCLKIANSANGIK